MLLQKLIRRRPRAKKMLITDPWEIVKQDPNSFLNIGDLAKDKNRPTILWMNGQIYYRFAGGILIPVETYKWLKAQGIDFKKVIER